MTRIEPAAAHEDLISAMAVDVAGAAQQLFVAGSIKDTFSELVQLSVATIDGCEFASIFVPVGTTGSMSIRTDPVVVEIDELQQRLGEGPCIGISAENLSFYAADLNDNARWPNFGREATRMGVRSLLALPLSGEGTNGVLSLYSRLPGAFGAFNQAKGLLLATIAALALSTRRVYEDGERRADHLHTRDLIAHAQGILMERELISGDEAFAILRYASQHLNVKLREVAQRLVDTGERPDTGRFGLRE